MRIGPLVIAACGLVMVGVLGAGCGSSSSTTGGMTAHRRATSPTPERERSPGIGWKAPIAKTVGPRRPAAGVGRLPGTEGIGARPCQIEGGRGEIGIFTDVPQPGCIRVTGAEPVLIVNRTEAYHRSEGQPISVALGPYGAKLLPQQAIRFAPVGRFLGPGYHHVTLGAGPGGVGILVLPENCAIFRPEPGESLCFEKDRPGRLRRWHRTVAELGAPACRGLDLDLSAAPHSTIGSGGTIYTTFFVANRSDAPCTVAGVPKVIGLGRDGGIVDVGEPKPLLRVGSRGGRLRVRLDPGEAATFAVAHYDGIGAGRCNFVSTKGMKVTVPGAGLRAVVQLPMRYCPEPGAGLGLRVGRIE
jgi:hypothetical protein